MKIVFFTLILIFSLSAFATQPEYTCSLPTSYQSVNYAANALKSYLLPLGYELNLDSVDVINGVAISGINREVKVLTPEYCAKTVLFTALDKKQNKRVGGSIYLITAVKDIKAKLGLDDLNSTAKKFQTTGIFSDDQFYLTLSRGYSDDSLSVDISPLDFHFH